MTSPHSANTKVFDSTTSRPSCRTSALCSVRWRRGTPTRVCSAPAAPSAAIMGTARSHVKLAAAAVSVSANLKNKHTRKGKVLLRCRGGADVELPRKPHARACDVFTLHHPPARTLALFFWLFVQHHGRRCQLERCLDAGRRPRAATSPFTSSCLPSSYRKRGAPAGPAQTRRRAKTRATTHTHTRSALCPLSLPCVFAPHIYW